MPEQNSLGSVYGVKLQNSTLSGYNRITQYELSFNTSDTSKEIEMMQIEIESQELHVLHISRLSRTA